MSTMLAQNTSCNWFEWSGCENYLPLASRLFNKEDLSLEFRPLGSSLILSRASWFLAGSLSPCCPQISLILQDYIFCSPFMFSASSCFHSLVFLSPLLLLVYYFILGLLFPLLWCASHGFTDLQQKPHYEGWWLTLPWWSQQWKC